MKIVFENDDYVAWWDGFGTVAGRVLYVSDGMLGVRCVDAVLRTVEIHLCREATHRDWIDAKRRLQVDDRREID